MFAELADIIPGAEVSPRFTTNRERFEARLSMVWCWNHPACSSPAWHVCRDCRGA
jgi:hypothetical protein